MVLEQSYLIKFSELSFFSDIDILDLRDYIEKKNFNLTSYNKDQIIGIQGDSYKDLLIILDGYAAAFMLSPSGKRVQIDEFNPPSPIAAAVLFSSQNFLPVELIALKDSTVILSIPKDEVIKMMQAFPLFLEHYLKDNGDKLLFLAEKIRLFQFNTLRQKVVSHIINQMKRQNSKTIRLVYSREELAQLMGVARPSLSREISKLAKEGLINVKSREILIENLPALQQIMNNEA